METYDCELLLVACGALERIEWAVVSDLSLPLAVEVVGHHVDKVEVFGNLWDIVASSDGFETSGDSGTQQETRLTRTLRLAFERHSQFLQEVHIRGTVVRTPAKKSVLNRRRFYVARAKDIELPGVFPINIETAEFVFSQEVDGLVYELVHSEDVGGEFFEGGGTKGPSSDRQHNLQRGVLLPQGDDSLVHVAVLVFGHGQFVVLERRERVDDVRAQRRVDVVRSEATGARAFLRPARHVAEHLRRTS